MGTKLVFIEKKRHCIYQQAVRENMLYFVFSSVTDLCWTNKEITMVRMYEIELECDALFV